MADIILNESNRGSTTTVAVGDRVVISLKESPTTGYMWTIDSFTPTVLALADSSFGADADAQLGGGGIRTISFNVLRAGQADIHLALRRSWEPAILAKDHFQVGLDSR